MIHLRFQSLSVVDPGSLGHMNVRLKFPADTPVGWYHCLSRVTDRRFIFEAAEKEHFVALLRECEAFCEVRVLTYCVMSNHFHVLVEVPAAPPPDQRPSVEQICAKLDLLSGHQNVGTVLQRFAAFRAANDAAGEAAYLATLHARLWDISPFMKMLKQRFSAWYNVRAGRKGTLWEERYKCVLVEGSGRALSTMAAYMDLNPVRAGIVSDPKDYPWCGYGEALAGGEKARLGLQRVVTALQGGKEVAVEEALEVYRKWVSREGSPEREEAAKDGQPGPVDLPREEALKVLEAKGKLPVTDYVRCRVRYFSDGAVFGGKEFVERVFEQNRERFGKKRKSGARKLKGLEGGDLCTVRDFQKRVFG